MLRTEILKMLNEKELNRVKEICILKSKLCEHYYLTIEHGDLSDKTLNKITNEFLEKEKELNLEMVILNMKYEKRDFKEKK